MPFYKCFVPGCNNVRYKTDDTYFFPVPSDLPTRIKWLNIVKHPEKAKRKLYCCEGHFDLDEDTTDLWAYHYLGGQLHLKPGVVPHILPDKEPDQVDFKIKQEPVSDEESNVETGQDLYGSEVVLSPGQALNPVKQEPDTDHEGYGGTCKEDRPSSGYGKVAVAPIKQEPDTGHEDNGGASQDLYGSEVHLSLGREQLLVKEELCIVSEPIDVDIKQEPDTDEEGTSQDLRGGQSALTPGHGQLAPTLIKPGRALTKMDLFALIKRKKQDTGGTWNMAKDDVEKELTLAYARSINSLLESVTTRFNKCRNEKIFVRRHRDWLASECACLCSKPSVATDAWLPSKVPKLPAAAAPGRPQKNGMRTERKRVEKSNTEEFRVSPRRASKKPRGLC